MLRRVLLFLPLTPGSDTAYHPIPPSDAHAADSWLPPAPFVLDLPSTTSLCARRLPFGVICGALVNTSRDLRASISRPKWRWIDSRADCEWPVVLVGPTGVFYGRLPPPEACLGFGIRIGAA
jgi:hypothetical protein